MITIHIPVAVLTLILGYIAGCVSMLFLAWAMNRRAKIKEGVKADE